MQLHKQPNSLVGLNVNEHDGMRRNEARLRAGEREREQEHDRGRI